MTVPKISSRAKVIGTIGRTTNFGYGLTRSGYKQFVNNKKYPEVLEAIVEFAKHAVPKGFFYNAITLNHGVKAKKHIDGHNIGNSVIVGLGDYSGGEVIVYNDDDVPKDYDVKLKPLMFNGAKYYHATQPFKGDRYTLIFFRHDEEETPIKGYEGQTTGV
jgi:hypothetical protein